MNDLFVFAVNQPKEYRWSNYHTNALGKVSTLITPHEEDE